VYVVAGNSAMSKEAADYFEPNGPILNREDETKV